VSIGPREGGGFGLAVKLQVEDKSLAQTELAAFVKEAHEKICPYSHATRGNVDGPICRDGRVTVPGSMVRAPSNKYPDGKRRPLTRSTTSPAAGDAGRRARRKAVRSIRARSMRCARCSAIGRAGVTC